MSYFTNKSILVIGGTGTVGLGLIKGLIKENPKVIRILSRDEYKQFQIQRHEEFIREYDNFRFLIGDVRDYERVERAMAGIDIVFNLAAMKHVGACEYNPAEAIKTNIDGINNIIKAAMKNNVQCVLFTSSDKAINPTNTYGATKLLAEKLIQAANYSKGNCRTKFISVRFGNVMGSRGSVIPLFKKQIIEENKITITDSDMSRFMMSLKDAVDLIMKACEISNGGELFILKMPVVNLGVLSEVLIEETCKKYNINKDKIVKEEIGKFKGEKLFEELMTREEARLAKDLGNMYVVLPENYSNGYLNKYGNYKNCEDKSYSSHDQVVIDEEETRNLLIQDGLI